MSTPTRRPRDIFKEKDDTQAIAAISGCLGLLAVVGLCAFWFGVIFWGLYILAHWLVR